MEQMYIDAINTQLTLGRTHKGRSIGEKTLEDLKAVASVSDRDEANECVVCGFIFPSSAFSDCINCGSTDINTV
jgi:hypothetical protein